MSPWPSPRVGGDKDELSSNVKPQRVGTFPYFRADPETRRKDFSEVRLPYTKEQAMLEADRCLKCGTPVCIDACPVQMDVRGMNEAVARGDFETAFHRMRETNPLVGTTARVCLQLYGTCEQSCAMQWAGQPISIGMIQRFVADWERTVSKQPDPAAWEKTGKRIAVIGAGPAGLAAADLLRRYGHEVTVYEERPIPGGTAWYGIPDYRLPKDVLLYEVERIKAEGVEIRTGMKVGRDVTLTDLLSEGSDAVLIATSPKDVVRLDVAGTDLKGVYDGYQFLEAVYGNGVSSYLQHPKYDLGNNVLVIGGVDGAVDSARTALRLTGGNVVLAYRATEAEMLADPSQIEEAKEEGVGFRFLASPKLFKGVGGRVVGATMSSMSLGEPDSSAGRNPQPIQGAEFDLECTSVILALGRGPSSVLQKQLGLSTGKGGGADVAENPYQTSMTGIFVSGDIMIGEESVGRALDQGRQAAQYVHEYVMNLQDKHVSLYDKYYTERTKSNRYWDMLLGNEERLPPP